jgi:DNA-binding response OmpR family regulator
MRILVADGHAKMRKVLPRILRSFGHEADAVGSLDEVRRRLEAVCVDLLITGIQLPDGEAWHEVPRLRERFDFMAFALTSFGTEAHLERSRRAG